MMTTFAFVLFNLIAHYQHAASGDHLICISDPRALTQIANNVFQKKNCFKRFKITL